MSTLHTSFSRMSVTTRTLSQNSTALDTSVYVPAIVSTAVAQVAIGIGSFV
jgi:hypothetical protein